MPTSGTALGAVRSVQNIFEGPTTTMGPPLTRISSSTGHLAKVPLPTVWRKYNFKPIEPRDKWEQWSAQHILLMMPWHRRFYARMSTIEWGAICGCSACHLSAGPSRGKIQFGQIALRDCPGQNGLVEVAQISFYVNTDVGDQCREGTVNICCWTLEIATCGHNSFFSPFNTLAGAKDLTLPNLSSIPLESAADFQASQ